MPPIPPLGLPRPARPSLRRGLWLQVYIPMAVGALIVGALVARLVRGMAGDASTLADVSAITLLIQAMALGVVPLILLTALAIGVVWLAGRLPARLRQVARVADEVAVQTHEFARAVRSPRLATRKVGWSLRKLAGFAIRRWL